MRIFVLIWIFSSTVFVVMWKFIFGVGLRVTTGELRERTRFDRRQLSGLFIYFLHLLYLINVSVLRFDNDCYTNVRHDFFCGVFYSQVSALVYLILQEAPVFIR